MAVIQNDVLEGVHMSQLIAWIIMLSAGAVIFARYLRAVKLSEGWEEEDDQ